MAAALPRLEFDVGAVVVLTLVLVVPASAEAAGQVALVVGNSAYAAIGRVPNPGKRRGRPCRRR